MARSKSAVAPRKGSKLDRPPTTLGGPAKSAGVKKKKTPKKAETAVSETADGLAKPLKRSSKLSKRQLQRLIRDARASTTRVCAKAPFQKGASELVQEIINGGRSAPNANVTKIKADARELIQRMTEDFLTKILEKAFLLAQYCGHQLCGRDIDMVCIMSERGRPFGHKQAREKLLQEMTKAAAAGGSAAAPE